MPRPPSFRSSLLISAVGIVALAGCDTSNLADKITGREGRKEQMVDGPRRAPLLNPQPSMMQPAMPPQQQMPPAARPQAAVDSPFDQFDESGAVVAPQPAKPLEMATDEEAGSVDSSFFDRLIPDKKAEKPAAEAKKVPEKPVRKPFIANVLSASEEEPSFVMDEVKPEAKPVVEAEPVFAEAPEPKFEPKPVLRNEPMKTVKAPEPVKPALSLTASEERDAITGFVPLVLSPAEDKSPVVADAQPAKIEMEKPAAVVEEKSAIAEEPEQVSKPSLLSRLMAPVVGEKTQASNPASDQEEAYPKLSSVPPTPDVFKDIKDERDEQIDSLKRDHASAQEQKETLAAEPSELAPPSMLVAPAATTLKPPATEPAAVLAAPVKPQEKETVLLGRISDPKLADNGEEKVTQKAPAPIEYKEDKMVEPVKPQPKPEPVIAAKPEMVAVDPIQETPQTPWWKRLGVFDDQPANANEPEAQQSEQQRKKPLVVEEPQTTVEPFKPLVETTPVQTRPTPMTEPVKATLERVPQDEANEEDAGAAEPVTDKPAQAKTLPPSRYAPPRQRQYYLVP